MLRLAAVVCLALAAAPSQAQPVPLWETASWVGVTPGGTAHTQEKSGEEGYYAIERPVPQAPRAAPRFAGAARAHALAFDGAALAPGLYVVRAEVPGASAVTARLTIAP